MTVALAKATRREQKQRRQNEAREAEERKRREEEEQEREREDEPESDPEAALLIAIVLLLLASLPAPALAERLAALTAPFGFSPATVAAVVLVLGVHAEIPEPDADTAALHAIQRTEAARRARYVLAAMRRLESGEPTAAEARLLRAHLRAEEKRQQAARRVDAAAAKWGDLLGWYARKDDRTTPECAHAHGRNFLASRPPAIGYPGMLHGGNCRCKPGPPWSQAPLLR